MLALPPTSQNKEAYQATTEQNPQQLATTIPPRQPLSPTQPAVPSGRRQRNSDVSKVILGIVLALLLLSGSGLLYYFEVTQPVRQRIHTIATASASIDSRTKLYLAAISGSPLLNDPLNHNDSTTINWVENTSPEGNSCAFRDGAYYATALQQGTFLCLAAGNDFSELSDFTYQIQMTITQGNEGGLIFRSDAIDQNNYPFSTNYYLFSVRADGHYGLSYKNDKNTTSNLILLKQGVSPVIQIGPNNPNLLTVIAYGHTIFLYINKHYITTVNDQSRSTGLIGVFAQKNDQNSEIAFRNAQIWNLEGKSLPV